MEWGNTGSIVYWMLERLKIGSIVELVWPCVCIFGGKHDLGADDVLQAWPKYMKLNVDKSVKLCSYPPALS